MKQEPTAAIIGALVSPVFPIIIFPEGDFFWALIQQNHQLLEHKINEKGGKLMLRFIAEVSLSIIFVEGIIFLAIAIMAFIKEFLLN